MAKKEKAMTHGVSEHEGKAWGHGQMANMPQDVVKKHYMKPGHYRGGVLDDTITGIDDTIGRSEGKSQKYLSNQH